MSRGFWSAREDIGAREAWGVAPIEGSHGIGKGVAVCSLADCFAALVEKAA